METPTSLSSQLSAYRLRDWLSSGWILELTASGAPQGSKAEFLVGGGDRSELSFDDLERSSCVVWAPEFFSLSSGVSSTGAFATRWVHQVSREDLLAWLRRSRGSQVPSAKISWKSPEKETFRKVFERLEKAFRDEGVKKAVPVVFANGLTAMSDRLEWIHDRVLAGLEGTSESPLRLYGCWNESSGFLGATPEELFSRDGDVVTSMAVAGTKALRALGERVEDPAAVEALSHELLNDPKERTEHFHVVEDIEKTLRGLGGTLEKSPTQVERFGVLLHLVTRLRVLEPTHADLRKLTASLHPTPALGVWPRDPELSLLRELHMISENRGSGGVSGGVSGGTEREGFGAPFLVKFGERVEAIVAIRQIRWNFEEGDRAHVVVGSGCGVVPESDLDREWKELAAKREAVMRLFRLSAEKSDENSEAGFWSLRVLENVVSLGVRNFVVCAGARNAPLVVAAEALRQASPEIRVESFFEERSAAFYALGLARATAHPVAILTTSGTAVSELLPAMAEADYSGVPLIAVTADRPRRLRYSGAPQSMPQNRIFEEFSECVWDLEEGDAFKNLDRIRSGTLLRPLHFNIALEEPLLSDVEKNPDGFAEAARAIVSTGRAFATNDVSKEREVSNSARFEKFSQDPTLSFAALGSVLEARRTVESSGVVAIVGALRSEDRAATAEFLSSHAIPCLLEAPSGLRGDIRLRELEIRGGDRDLQRWCRSGEVSHVIRIGGVPTTRVWRDLDEVDIPTQTLSISHLRFSGLGRGQFIHLPGKGELRKFLRESSHVGGATKTLSTLREKTWLSEDSRTHEKLERLLTMLPSSEPSFVRALSCTIPEDALVYVGNSLPIRWWDLAATRDRTHTVEANRGVNGIDGQISTALGLALGAKPSETWVLVGDLTALYDLAGPWALSKFKNDSSVRTRIVVLNNSGGRIFSRVLAKAPGGAKPFENEHDLGFENWAAMWKLDYRRIEDAGSLSDIGSELGSHAVLELIPSSAATHDFWAGLT